MNRRLALNDFKRTRVSSLTLAAFIFLASLLTSVSVALIWNLQDAISTMMERAKTPDYMQMHSGTVDMNRMDAFAQTQNVVDWQVLEMINIDAGLIRCGETTLRDSVQDNGFSVQSDRFDFLVDTAGQPVYPQEGHIYLPLHYRSLLASGTAEKKPAESDTQFISIGNLELQVDDYIRDAMMNAALVSSKRFLVHPADLERLRPIGVSESLIEFRLEPGTDLGSFEAAYIQAGLESDGPPAITAPLIRLINSISDGLMIAVLLLIGGGVILVTFLVIRFSLLAKVEDDFREIAVLKAIGFRNAETVALFSAKYRMITIIATLLGFLTSPIVLRPLMANIRLYMGTGKSPHLGTLFALIGALLIYLVIHGFVHHTFGVFKTITPAAALRGEREEKRRTVLTKLTLSKTSLRLTPVIRTVKDLVARRGLYLTLFILFAVATFLCITPQNIYDTIADRSFIRYMGIGDCDVRFDLQQIANIPEKTAAIVTSLRTDPDVRSVNGLISYGLEEVRPDGSTKPLKVEIGDHTIFPTAYLSGEAPTSDREIALSVLNAEELERNVGDSLRVRVDGTERDLIVSGIYPDITNGGKTARATFPVNDEHVLWAIVTASLEPNVNADAKEAEWNGQFPGVKIAKIQTYINQMFGDTMAAIRKSAVIARLAMCFLAALITVLFFAMLISKDRAEIAALKTVGFTNRTVRNSYRYRLGAVLLLALPTGILLAATIGRDFSALLISNFGAHGFAFKPTPAFNLLIVPLLLTGTTMAAITLAVNAIGHLNIADSLKDGNN